MDDTVSMDSVLDLINSMSLTNKESLGCRLVEKAKVGGAASNRKRSVGCRYITSA